MTDQSLQWEEIAEECQQVLTEDVQDLVVIATYPNGEAGYLYRMKNGVSRDLLTDALLEVVKRLNGGEH